jgi:broad specificity phosphatase PhoE
MGMFSRRSAGYLVVAAGLALTLAGPFLAQSQGQEVTNRDEKQLVESLRSGGYVIVVRHGATFSDQADTDPFNFDNIAKQRNLSEKGKQLAKEFGDAIRQVGIPAGDVYTSNFNRAFETAVLAGFKDIEKTTDLTEGGLVVSPDENSRRAAALRKMLAQMPQKGKNTFLITHKPNIIDALGKDWFDVKEGEASIFKPEDGKYRLVARVQMEDWLKLVAPSRGALTAYREDRLRAGCSRRREDGERGQELRTVDRSLHPHHRERDRNLWRSRHRDRYRMVYLSPTAAADIRAGRRRLQDPHRPITLARPRGTRGGRYR